MSEKQIDEQLLEERASDNELQTVSAIDENNDAKEQETDLFLERIKKLDNRERVFKMDEEYVPAVSEEITTKSTDEKSREVEDGLDAKIDDFKEEEKPNKKSREDFEKARKERNKKRRGPITLVIGVLVLVAVIFGAVKVTEIGKFNKYNPMGYPVIEGKTFGDAAKKYESGYKKFLKDNHFPTDIPKKTPIFVAEYYMRAVDVAEKNYSVNYETFKKELGIPETATLKNGKTVKINENTMWYIVKDELPLSSIVREKDFEEYKKYYGLDDNVTIDTLYKEIRPQIEEVLVKEVKEKYLLKANEEEEAEQTEQTEQVEPEQVQSDEAQAEE